MEEYSFQAYEKINTSLNKKDKDDFITDLNSKINADSLTFNIIFICKFKLIMENHFPIPKKYYLLAFKTAQNFLIYYNKDNKLYCQEINNHSTLFPALMPNYLELKKRVNENDEINFYVFRFNGSK